MLRALTGLILCQFAGEVIARVAGLPIPGPVLGLVSIVVGPLLWRVLRITDWRARGLAAGTAGHGLATARVLLHETAETFGGLAIGLNGIVTALIVPPLARWLTG